MAAPLLRLAAGVRGYATEAFLIHQAGGEQAAPRTLGSQIRAVGFARLHDILQTPRSAMPSALAAAPQPPKRAWTPAASGQAMSMRQP